jgi:predicted nucleic acid-binding Zn finger protein|uniref:Uncharacterized protein n=1 Tax=Leviviridae sp. TaxID=2027243 RepID=A0A514CZF1_9VIRU|nr:MAG: hypothetical protein H2BulkLitter12682_000005 [Leviviridae sp.]
MTSVGHFDAQYFVVLSPNHEVSYVREKCYRFRPSRVGAVALGYVGDVCHHVPSYRVALVSGRLQHALRTVLCGY